MKRILLFFMLFISTLAIAQTRGPDCTLPINLTATGRLAYDNRTAGCTTWALTYTANGFTGVQATLEGATDNNGVAGTWGTWPTIVGAPVLPLTDTKSGSITVVGYKSWVSFRATLTGTGNIVGVLYGWRTPAEKLSENRFDSGLMAVTTSNTTVTTSPIIVRVLYCSNTLGDSAGDAKLTITDNTGTAYVNNFVLTGGSTVQFIENDFGIKFNGLKWTADTNGAISCQVAGIQ